jgi:peptidoglycan/LPS O-acetylase OafA/YrhL
MSEQTLTAVPAAAPAQRTRVTPPAAVGGRLVALDGMRFVAAIMVVLYHFVAFTGGNAKAWDAPAAQVFPGFYLPASYGWLGVQFFFLISGFAICMSSWGRSLGAFFRSRVCRLYPAYWAAVLLTAAVVTAFPVVNSAPDTSDVLVNLTMLHEPLGVPHVDGVYWTLWVEMRFYLLFALVVWKGVNYRRVVVFCCAWMAGSVVAVKVKEPLLDLIFMPTCAPYFIAGVALYLIYRFGSDLTLWGIVVMSWLLAQHHLINDVSRVAKNVLHRHLPAQPAVLIVTLGFVAVAAVALGWLSWVRWSWITAAGALTYPVYLLHERIGWVFIHHLHGLLPPYVLLALVIAVMLTAASLLHRLVERPLARRLRAALPRRLAPRQP